MPTYALIRLRRAYATNYVQIELYNLFILFNLGYETAAWTHLVQ